jgi:RNA polymerase sigma-70 factor (ECF subfamily)
MGATDKYYIGRCLDGHPDDFRHLIRRYQGPLLAHLVGRLGGADKAEEAAQETLVRAYFGLAKLSKRDSFFAWLLGIANRVAKEQLRTAQRRRQMAEVLAEKAPNPELSHDHGLERAIAALPQHYQQIVLLRYYGSQSCSDVAKQLDMPLGTVTKMLSRAYAMLRQHLQEQDEVQK